MKSNNNKLEDIKLPELGESVKEATITRWLVKCNEKVKKGQVILEVSTDKVDTEIPAPVSGIIKEILVEEDESTTVGSTVATVDPTVVDKKDKETVLCSINAPIDTVEKKSKNFDGEFIGKKDLNLSNRNSYYASPLVRKEASNQGINLSTIKGSGKGGRITREDLNIEKEKYITENSSSLLNISQTESPEEKNVISPIKGTTKKISRTRQIIAKRMKDSLNISAQLTQVHEVDMTRIANIRLKKKDEFFSREGIKITFLPFFAKATVKALQQFPKLNSLFDDKSNTITYPNSENLAIAVDTEKGLLVPVIKNAGNLSISGFAHSIKNIADKARKGMITPEELSGGTFTITNYGSVGAISDTPIINQPQSAILGIGAIIKRPYIITNDDGFESIAIRSIATLSLTYDHRTIDGADAGRFMQALKRNLEDLKSCCI